ncbi:ankyrin repeat domain-containing protein 16 [Capsaspora owczarzaki ATCC 30864]|uniref:ankyrin repeat domain-containing protein 16 n=1 Tax=Capsaspora owczarzaki (strain ATCC 30864) TaxID=595528 RepID=UPI00035260E3|nr:ankyrin repeat domain-containing protein 16 [Capsaspora owczarzaki ATCC 30864]|eukprot:XP_004347064.2 ankyrin repeat domain-containing protein 16 [Capsaspora owczarzaki ATCC 30864]
MPHAVMATTPSSAATTSSSATTSGDTRLHIAVRTRSLEQVQRALDRPELTDERKRSLVNAANADGRTALHEAACLDNEAVAKLLLDQGAEIDALKKAGWTPLMLALSHKRNVIARMLVLEGRASLFTSNKDGWTPLHIATREGDPETIRFLIKQAPATVAMASKNGRLPIHTAAFHKHVEATAILLSEGFADPVARDVCGMTPQMFAASSGSAACLAMLLAFRCGLTVEEMLPRAESPSGQDDDAHVIDACEQALLRLISKQHARAVQLWQMLLERDKCGTTAFLHAAMTNSIHVLAFLLRLVHECAEALAPALNQRELAEEVFGHPTLMAPDLVVEDPDLDNGARVARFVNTTDFRLNTALHIAARAGAIDAVEFLVERAHVDRSLEDSFGRTACQLAQLCEQPIAHAYLRKLDRHPC